MTVTSTDPLETLTIDEVAEKLRVSVSTIKRHVRKGTIPSFTLGDRRLFRASDVAAFVAGLVDGTPNSPKLDADGFPIVQSRRGRRRV